MTHSDCPALSTAVTSCGSDTKFVIVAAEKNNIANTVFCNEPQNFIALPSVVAPERLCIYRCLPEDDFTVLTRRPSGVNGTGDVDNRPQHPICFGPE